MSNDTMPCGCEGHADNAAQCRYPELERQLARERMAAKARLREYEEMKARAEQAERERDSERLAREGAQQHRREAEARLKEATERNLALVARAERAEADNAAMIERCTCPASLAMLNHPGAALLERMRALEAILRKWHVDLLSVNPEFNDPEYNALKVPRE